MENRQDHWVFWNLKAQGGVNQGSQKRLNDALPGWLGG
jgi:hypothetical protein